MEERRKEAGKWQMVRLRHSGSDGPRQGRSGVETRRRAERGRLEIVTGRERQK